jgi:PP-loop superfamily ATP-utilizing enzyme
MRGRPDADDPTAARDRPEPTCERCSVSEVTIVVRERALDEKRAVASGTTAGDLFEDRSVVVARING